MNLLDHMEIPPGVAKNQALRENIFVTLTCILLKIPLFVVGKPGSGKTLSLQLIFRYLSRGIHPCHCCSSIQYIKPAFKLECDLMISGPYGF